MARQIEVNAAGAPGAGAVVTLYAIGGSSPVADAENMTVSAHGSKPGAWVCDIDAGVAAGNYEYRFTTAAGTLLAVGRRVLGSATGVYASEPSDAAAALIDHLETQARGKGSLSYLRMVELLVAAVVGDVTAVGGVETFEFADGTNAFTSTVSSGNRSVALS
jgi:hypothetical protein